MAKRGAKAQGQPAVSKPVLIFGGVALGVGVLFFVVTTFLGGGDGGEEIPGPTVAPVTSQAPTGGQPGAQPDPGSVAGADPTPSPTVPGLTEGGRDPFREPGGGANAGADP